jgi:hypothetical protein
MQVSKAEATKRRYGRWVFSGPDTYKHDHFGTSGSGFPAAFNNISGNSERWVPTPYHRKTLESLLGIFKSICPKLPYFSLVYHVGLLTTRGPKPPVLRYNLHIGFEAFYFDKEVLKRIGTSFNSLAWDAFGSFFVNDYHLDHESPLQSVRELSYTPVRGGKGGDLRPTGLIVAVAPRDNFAERCEKEGEPIPESLRLTNLPPEIERWQSIEFQRGGRKENTTCTVTNHVLLTRGNRLPFDPVSIGKVLEILDTLNEEMVAYFKHDHETYTIKEEAYQRHENTRKNADRTYQENLTRLQEEKDVIAFLRREHATRLNQPAILRPAEADYITKNNLWSFTEGAKRNRSFRDPRQIFIDKPREGVALVHLRKDTFQGLRDGELRCLSLQWREYHRPASNRLHGQPPQLGENIPWSDRTGEPDPGQAMRTRLDWAKLRALIR